MITIYDITASNLVTAVEVATKRAHNDGFARASVVSSKQISDHTWSITMFVSN